jgi:hypothetical protein
MLVIYTVLRSVDSTSFRFPQLPELSNGELGLKALNRSKQAIVEACWTRDSI